MKVNDILKKINDCGLYIEIIDAESGASYGIFKKNDALLVYDNEKKNKKVKKINVQYYQGKRILMLGVE